MRGFSAQETYLSRLPQVIGCPHTRVELEGLTGAAYFHEGGQESALHLT